MPTLDLSFTITAIIAICALISPVATTLINNHHQKVMKKLEYEAQEKQRQITRKREIFEDYLCAAGACLQHATPESLVDYGRHSSLVLAYVPEDLQNDIRDLEECIMARDPSSLELLDTIALSLRPILQEL